MPWFSQIVITEALAQEVGAFPFAGNVFSRTYPNLDESRHLYR
jgi:hypothetical protein